MSMVKKTLLYLVGFWLALVILMPKAGLYYKLEEMLSSQDVILNEAQLSEDLFGVTLNDVDLYVKGIKVAHINQMKLLTLFAVTMVKIDELKLDHSLKRMAPEYTEHATIRHTVFSPLQITIEAKGSFGGMDGSVDVSTRRVHLDFNESRGVRMLKPTVKKGEKGWVYETSF